MSALPSSDDEQLAISIVAKLGELEKQMAKANGITARAYREMTLSSRKATRQMEDDAIRSTVRINQALASVGTKVGAFGKTMMSALGTVGGGFAGGLLGGVVAGSLSGVVSNLGAISKGIAEVGDKAKMAGLSNKAFQELGFVASQNRIEVDALTDGMKELQLRADEWIKTGSGGGAESFQRLGFSATELASRLKDPSALLVEIIRRVQTLDKAAQIRIFDELFGGQGGEKFVQLISQGADGVQATIDRSNELGAVLSDDVIAKADEIDRKFSAISATVATGLKSEIIEVVGYFSELLDKLNELDQQSNANIQRRLVQVYAGRESLKEHIAADEAKSAANPDNVVLLDQLEGERARLEELTAEALRLRDILDERAGWKSGENVADTAADGKEKVDRLGTALGGTVSGATAGSTAMRTYADAVRALKEEIPDLAKELTNLDAKAKIETVYASALRMASTPAELLAASNLHDAALEALAGKDTKAAASKGMLDLIGKTEGTDKGRGYNETLGYGRFTGGDVSLSTMTLDQVMALQGRMLANPANTSNSSAVGRYQITRETLRDLMGRLGLKGSDTFDPSMQDRLAQELIRQSGGDVGKLRGRWTSLQGVDDQTISQAYGQSSLSLGNMDPGLKSQADAYQNILRSGQEYIQQQGQQAALVGQNAAEAVRLRHEQELLNEAERDGVALTPERLAALQRLAAEMANADQATQELARSQQQLDEFNDELRDIGKGALKGFISDLMQGKSAADALSNALSNISDKLLDMALDSLFDGLGKDGGGGLFSWLASANGNAFTAAGVVPFASGGVVDKPTFFKFASGAGVMGEAGPEAIMPLKRDASGRLGVAAHGAGGGVGQTVYSPHITNVVQSTGNHMADEQLARRMNQEARTQLENHLLDVVRREGRPGGMLSKGKFV